MWRINWPIVNAFLAVATQWEQIPLIDGRVLWQGLNYSRVRDGLKLAGIRVSPAQWLGVQIMEAAAAAALNGR